MRDLSIDNAKRADRVIPKRDTLKNAREFFNGREMITTAFKNGAFPLPDQSSIYQEDKKEFIPPKDFASESDYDEFDTPQDIPDLQSEESAAQRHNQLGKGPKILTPDQMLSRLPITLAQLLAGKNSQKLKKEIIQLLHSLHHSKKINQNNL